MVKPRHAGRRVEPFFAALFADRQRLAGKLGFFLPFVITAQALTIAGFIRHALRPGERDSFELQPGWAHVVYPAGILLLIMAQFVLGLIGWNGALQVGAWLQALIASISDRWAGLGNAAFPHPQPDPRPLGHIHCIAFERSLSTVMVRSIARWQRSANPSS